MNVRELIAKLQELDPELPVGVETSYCEDSALAEDVYAEETGIYLPDPDRPGHIKYTKVMSVWLK